MGLIFELGKARRQWSGDMVESQNDPQVPVAWLLVLWLNVVRRLVKDQVLAAMRKPFPDSGRNEKTEKQLLRGVADRPTRRMSSGTAVAMPPGSSDRVGPVCKQHYEYPGRCFISCS